MVESCNSDSITVISSSEALNWRRVGVVHGRNNGSLVLNNVSTPYHHVCMIVGKPISWELDDGNGVRSMIGKPGGICIYPADSISSRRIHNAHEFIAVGIAPELLSIGDDEDMQPPPTLMKGYNIEDPQLEGLLRTLSAEAAANNPNGRLFVESLTTALSVHLVNHYSIRPIRGERLSPKSLKRALDYIENNLAEDISLDVLAKEANLSKYYFCRLFKSAVGNTPYQYILQRRLERAKASIQRGNIKLADAAFTFGFSDQSHFGRLFKKSFGITPGDFQRSLAASHN